MPSTPSSVSLVLKLHQGLIKPRFPGPSPRVSDSVSDSGRSSKICMSNKFPGDTDAVGSGLHFEEKLV